MARLRVSPCAPQALYFQTTDYADYADFAELPDLAPARPRTHPPNPCNPCNPCNPRFNSTALRAGSARPDFQTTEIAEFAERAGSPRIASV